MLTKVQKIIIGVVTGVVVLGIAAILVWYFLIKQQNTPKFIPEFMCTDNKSCTPCNKLNETCNFDSIEQCQASCVPSPKFKSWHCGSNGCIGNYDHAGTYTSLSECQQHCSTPQTSCWLNTQDSLDIQDSNGQSIKPSSISIDQLNALLSQKDKNNNNIIYGQDMVIQCSDRPAQKGDTWSETFCNNNQHNNQLLVCQKTDKGPPYGKCQPFFSATGSKLTLKLNANNEITDRSQRTFSNLTDKACKSPKKYYRGVCLDNIVPTKWTQEKRPYGVAFYHGGKTGLPESNTRCAASYLKQIALFSNEKNMNRTFLSVDAPLVTKQNPYFLQPQFLVKHFLKNLNLTSKINNTSQPMEAGIIVYANPHDSSWNFQFDQQNPNNPFLQTCQAQWASDKDYSMFPVHDKSMCFNNIYYQNLLGGQIDKPDDPNSTCDKFTFTQLENNPPCLQNCETSKCASYNAKYGV